MIDGWDISSEIALRWMSSDQTDNESKLADVMTWCHQATSHYLNQSWPRFMLPLGIPSPQCVNWMSHMQSILRITQTYFKIMEYTSHFQLIMHKMKTMARSGHLILVTKVNISMFMQGKSGTFSEMHKRIKPFIMLQENKCTISLASFKMIYYNMVVDAEPDNLGYITNRM